MRADSTVAATLNRQPSSDSTAMTAAMIKMALRFSPATPVSIMLASAVGSSMADTAESSIRISSAATCFPWSFTRDRIVPMDSSSSSACRKIFLDKRE